MREKYLWLVIAVLTILSLGQACYIYEQTAAASDFAGQPPAQPEIRKMGYAEKAYDAQWEQFRKWRDRIAGRLKRGTPLLEPDFDVFFDDNYFSRRLTPFDEMEHIRRQMSDLFQGSEKSSFDDYWNKWFKERMVMGEFRTDIARTDKDVILTILIPELVGNEAAVDIGNGRIRVSFSAKTASEKKSPGGIVRTETSQSYIKILPIPDDAAAGSGKVETDGRQVKIKFERKNN